jgi:hypothetical protein
LWLAIRPRARMSYHSSRTIQLLRGKNNIRQR